MFKLKVVSYLKKIWIWYFYEFKIKKLNFHFLFSILLQIKHVWHKSISKTSRQVKEFCVTAGGFVFLTLPLEFQSSRLLPSWQSCWSAWGYQQQILHIFFSSRNDFVVLIRASIIQYAPQTLHPPHVWIHAEKNCFQKHLWKETGFRRTLV